MLTDTPRWSHARDNEVVPSPWQATSAPGLLRQTAHQVLVRHPIDLATPDRAAARGAALDETASRPHAALPPGRRVVAPRGGRRDASPWPSRRPAGRRGQPSRTPSSRRARQGSEAVGSWWLGDRSGGDIRDEGIGQVGASACILD